MIDWKRKINMLAALVMAGDLVTVQIAVGIQKLLEMEQQAMEAFWTRSRSSKKEKEEAHQAYIEAIRAANDWSEKLDRIGGK